MSCLAEPGPVQPTRKEQRLVVRIADVLTASRIVASPIIVWLIVSGERDIAYYLFAAAAITDLLDGYFARRSKKLTSYGATFDGLGDFILIFPTMFAIAAIGEGFWLLIAVLIGLAIAIPVLVLISKRKGNLTIPHLDTNLAAALIYPTIMAYIIGWQYAEILVLVLFPFLLLYYGRKYILYLRNIENG